MSKKRSLESPVPSALNCPGRTRNTFLNTPRYRIHVHSPGFDTNTPDGPSYPQSQGPYVPPAKVSMKKVYHKMHLSVVPLKRRRGRKRLFRDAVESVIPSTDFDIKTCGYNHGKPDTQGQFSSHLKLSAECQCELFLKLLMSAGETWHWKN